MASSPDRLTALQRDLLHAFFARERRMFLTGGAALAGFDLNHRATEDLDFFAARNAVNLDDARRALEQAAIDCNCSTAAERIEPGFQHRITRRNSAETCIVDPVVDAAPQVESEKRTFGEIRVDTLRDIAANKLSALLSRSEIKDLVDFALLIRTGKATLHQALADARAKDSGFDEATLAWVLDEIRISPEARLPGAIPVRDIEAFRVELVRQLRAEAFRRTQQGQG